MGRRKLEIKRIENKSSRQVTLCKRRNGLMEKARQLSILCESSVAVVIVSDTGKLYSSSSGDRFVEKLLRVDAMDQEPLNWNGMAKILEHYEIQHADDLKASDFAEKSREYLSHKELLEIIQCKLEELNADNISVESLVSLEEQFKNALSVIRATKTEVMMELVKTLQEKAKLLREENQVLANQLTKMEKKRLLEIDDERAMSPEIVSGNNPPETLPLLNPSKPNADNDDHDILMNAYSTRGTSFFTANIALTASIVLANRQQG